MVHFKPPGWHAVTPRVFADDVGALVGFLRSVFSATGEYHPGHPAEMRIDDSLVMVSEGAGREAMSTFLYVYVPDTDAVLARAVAGGAQVLEASRDMPYGDRRAMVRDPWGNTWQIATHMEDLTPDEARKRMSNSAPAS